MRPAAAGCHFVAPTFRSAFSRFPIVLKLKVSATAAAQASSRRKAAASRRRDDHTLALDWQDIHCTQFFRRASADAMVLEMRCPEQDFLLRVDFSRLSGASCIKEKEWDWLGIGQAA